MRKFNRLENDFLVSRLDRGVFLKRLGILKFLEDSVKEGLATHSSINAWRIPWTEELVGHKVCGVTKSQA